MTGSTRIQQMVHPLDKVVYAGWDSVLCCSADLNTRLDLFRVGLDADVKSYKADLRASGFVLRVERIRFVR